MTDSNYTHILMIVDKSGSMRSLTKDTIGGYNAFLDEMRKLPGKTHITTVLFDTEFVCLNANEDVHTAKVLSEDTYRPDGFTALLDAMGRIIADTGQVFAGMREDERPGKVIAAIITDGEENSSREYSRQTIKSMVEEQQEKYKWNFVFLGANIDSFAAAGSLGIGETGTTNYSATGCGTQSAYRGMAKAVLSVAENGTLDENWKVDVQ